MQKDISKNSHKQNPDIAKVKAEKLRLNLLRRKKKKQTIKTEG